MHATPATCPLPGLLATLLAAALVVATPARAQINLPPIGGPINLPPPPQLVGELQVQRQGDSAFGQVTSPSLPAPLDIQCGTAGNAQRCRQTYPVGTWITLSAQALGHGAMAGWGGDCAGTARTSNCTVRIRNSGATPVTARFRAPVLRLTMTGAVGLSAWAFYRPSPSAAPVDIGSCTRTPTQSVCSLTLPRLPAGSPGIRVQLNSPDGRLPGMRCSGIAACDGPQASERGVSLLPHSQEFPVAEVTVDGTAATQLFVQKVNGPACDRPDRTHSLQLQSGVPGNAGTNLISAEAPASTVRFNTAPDNATLLANQPVRWLGCSGTSGLSLPSPACTVTVTAPASFVTACFAAP